MKPLVKRGIALLIILSIATTGSLAACSETTGSSTSSSTASTQSSEPTSVGSFSSGSATASESTLDQRSSASASGITPSFKEAMDEYESFIEGYCDFMRKYMDSGYSASMMSDYSKWMNQYSTMMAKIQAVDSKSLSAADSAYYLEVVNRTNQKLASIL